jgi:hypothetical protein
MREMNLNPITAAAVARPQRCGWFCSALAVLCLVSTARSQSVCLPSPRLLTTLPMGGQAGTTVEVTITGDNLDDADDLIFSDSRITAAPKLDTAAKREAGKYVVAIAADCPAGLYEARVMSRLGLSSARVFSVGTLPEVLQKKPNSSLETAMDLPLNSICNGVVSERAVDHYVFEGRAGQRVIVDCATRGIDSKLNAVVIVADAAGRDLVAERRGGVLDFAVPADGRYVIKVHELTFKGGPAYFYRLGLWELPADAPIERQPGTRPVNSFSWPPAGLAVQATLKEIEPNHEAGKAQRLSLPCDVAGSFFPAADVDVYEFEAKAGEEWWVEVASERLGLPTEPAVLVQHAATGDAGEILTDVVELSDVPSPVKVSSNAYAYDGPPYNSGTSDVLGQLLIKQDGIHRLRLADLFGGTRSDPGNVYRLVIRKAQPDFALVAWALHMELRNGDRNALSKPFALRNGATIALEVVAFRRDGFDGEIELGMEGLPQGVTARGLRIPSGQSRGFVLLTAEQEAPRGWTNARLFGRATIGDQAVERPCRIASMAWPIPDHWQDLPSPRLVADVPVSVSGFEFAPITIAPASSETVEAVAGEKVTIPLVQTPRCEFSGAKTTLRPLGAGFEKATPLEVTLAAESAEAVLDLAALNTPPGDYVITYHGPAVAKYRHRPDLVEAAKNAVGEAEQELAAATADAKQATEAAGSVTDESKAGAQQVVEAAAARKKEAEAAVAAAKERLKQAEAAAQPKEIADIVVTEPIAIRVKPAETK